MHTNSTTKYSTTKAIILTLNFMIKEVVQLLIRAQNTN